MYRAAMRQGYRVAYRVLWALSFVRKPRGRGVKALLVNDGEVLLLMHTYGPREWELPGGGSRRREDLHDTLRRELREELGIEVDVATAIGTFGGPGRFSGIGVSYFRVELDDRDVLPDPIEIAQVAWFDPAAPPRPLGGHATRALSRHREAVASPAEESGESRRRG
jgi:8-oxo-dGTP pyrophosphatase MutT (NUDIX family)